MDLTETEMGVQGRHTCGLGQGWDETGLQPHSRSDPLILYGACLSFLPQNREMLSSSTGERRL